MSGYPHGLTVDTKEIELRHRLVVIDELTRNTAGVLGAAFQQEAVRRLGDPSRYRLTDDGRIIFGDGPVPFVALFEALELGYRVTLQHGDGRKVTFESESK